MKKQLLGAALAVTVAFPALADVSISGNSFIRFADRSYTSETNDSGYSSVWHRVRIALKGTSGNTTVHTRFRNDGNTRVDDGTDTTKDALLTDYLYITTKIGNINIKAGDWWQTIGTDAVWDWVDDIEKGVQVSTVVNGWTLAAISSRHDDDSSADNMVFKVAGNINPNWSLELVKVNDYDNGKSTTTYGSATGEDDNGFYNLMITGNVEGFDITAETFRSSVSDADMNLLKVSKNINGIKWTAFWQAAQKNLYSAYDVSGATWANLNLSVWGTSGSYNGDLALFDLNKNYNPGEDSTSLVALQAKMKYAGLDFQVSVGEYNANQDSDEYIAERDATGVDTNCKATVYCDETSLFKDIVVTYPLSKGSSLRASYGDWAGEQSMGARIDVSF